MGLPRKFEPLSRYYADEVRRTIKVAALIGLLHSDAFGDKKITVGQRASIKILLDKVLPDLANMQVTGADGGPLIVKIVKFSKE